MDSYAACCFECATTEDDLDGLLQVYENPQDLNSEILLCDACAKALFDNSDA